MTTDITTLNDLSFTACDADGLRCDWQPERGSLSTPGAMLYGLMCVQRELAQLARVDEHDAYTAIVQALTSHTWNDQCSEEYGFADGLARLAIIGLRAVARSKECPFDTEFEPEQAYHASLALRVQVMEAQLEAMKVKPWRTWSQAERLRAAVGVQSPSEGARVAASLPSRHPKHSPQIHAKPQAPNKASMKK